MAATPSGVFVPPGQHPPFATITEDDHAAWVIIATAVGLCMTLLFAGIRVLIRSTISPGYGLDDALLAISTGLATIQAGVILGACAHGLGKSVKLIEPDELGKVQLMYYVANLFWDVALGLSKISVAVFLLRLTPVQKQRRLILGLIGAISVWTVILIFVNALQCHLSRPWILAGRGCSNILVPWYFLETVGSLFEMIIFGISVWLVWGLVTSVSNKVIVAVAFGFRLPMIVWIGFRLGSLTDTSRLASDPTLYESIFICWTQTELNYSLMAATIPILRPLVNNLATHYGGGHGASSDGYGTGTGGGSYNRTTGARSRQGARQSLAANAIKMSTLRSITRSKTREPSEDDEILSSSVEGGVKNGSSWPLASTSANVYPGTRGEGGKRQNGDASSVGSNDSQKMIIRKDVQWEIRRESDL